MKGLTARDSHSDTCSPVLWCRSERSPHPRHWKSIANIIAYIKRWYQIPTVCPIAGERRTTVKSIRRLITNCLQYKDNNQRFGYLKDRNALCNDNNDWNLITSFDSKSLFRLNHKFFFFRSDSCIPWKRVKPSIRLSIAIMWQKVLNNILFFCEKSLDFRYNSYKSHIISQLFTNY